MGMRGGIHNKILRKSKENAVAKSQNHKQANVRSSFAIVCEYVILEEFSDRKKIQIMINTE